MGISSLSTVTDVAIDSTRDRRLMLFAPWCFGHHPIYLGHLIRHWCEQQLPGTLEIVVMPAFLQAHPDVVELPARCGSDRVRFVAMTAQEQAALEAKDSGIARAFQQYQLICKYAESLQATEGLILFFDSCQIPLVLGRQFPCPFSGIYYQPTFHYAQLAGYVPAWKERVQQWREQLFLRRILHNPTFKTLFCLDPFAIDSMQRWSRSPSQVVHLPDPVELDAESDSSCDSSIALRQTLDIEPNRKVLLCFGRLADRRKGISQLAEAIARLPAPVQQNICLVLAGEPDPKGQQLLESWLLPLSQSVQIVRRYGFIPDSLTSAYFQLADVVMAPYQRHVGMSGILLQAAAAEKPVLTSDYGLMGELARRYRLGVVVDAADPDAIAQGLQQLLTEPIETLCDRVQMQAFVQQNSIAAFAETIFQQV